MLKGIVTVATGHAYYGRFAYNLAVTIKAIDPGFPIAIIHSERSLNHLSAQQQSIFDYKILLPESECSGFGTKLFVDKLSPFEETIFLDSDMAWMPKNSPNKLFDDLKDCEYTGITEGVYDISGNDKTGASPRYYFWADPEEIKKVYNLKEGKLYQWRSEVIYFKKTDKVMSMFNKARQIYKNPKLSTVKRFGEQIPDELAINISCAIHDIHPHRYQWTPAFWTKLHGEHIPVFEELYNSYYLLSCGSNSASGNLKKIYDRLMKAACHKMGVQHIFPLYAKKEFITDRKKM